VGDELDFAILLLRVVVGLTMAAHGWNKFFGGGKMPGTRRWFDSIGMRPGRVHAPLAAVTEAVAGALLALGALTSFASAAFVALMVVAGVTVHRGSGFFVNGNGWEYNLVLATVAVALALTGPGQWSVDAALGIDSALSGWTGFVVALLGGLVAAGALLAVGYRPGSVSAQS
jgi:putative oxidoreductase